MMAMKNDHVKTEISRSFMALLHEKAIENITVSELVKKAGVSRMSFYRNFETKKDVIKYYFAEVVYKDVLDHYPYRRVNIWTEDFAVSFFTGLRQIREDVLLIDRIGLTSIVQEIFVDKSIEFAGDMPASSIDRYWLYYISGAALCAGIEWLKTGCRETPEEMAKSLTGFMNSKITAET